MARQGKIARLPAALRRELCERLADGKLGPEILPWINAQPETRPVLNAHFAGADINAQNLSDWRDGGFKDWLKQREREDNIKRLAKYSATLAKAGGGAIAEGAMAIASGRILELLEQTASGDTEDLDLNDLVLTLTRLRNSELDKARLDLAERRENLKSESLDLSRQKFQAQTVANFLKWAGTKEAQAILDSGKPSHVQTGLLRELMFGKDESTG